jgi:alpha-tubulin suppressor-like RCC1 family protein
VLAADDDVGSLTSPCGRELVYCRHAGAHAHGLSGALLGSHCTTRAGDDHPIRLRRAFRARHRRAPDAAADVIVDAFVADTPYVEDVPVPRPVWPLGRITAGPAHTCAINSGHALYCWGSNTDGELGTGGSPQSVDTPQAVVGLGSGVDQVAAWAFGTCAITYSGHAYCWGLDMDAQLGDNPSPGTWSRNAPVAVCADSACSSYITTAVAVGGGAFEGGNCLILRGGQVMCAGEDVGGELGLGQGTGLDYPTPQKSVVTNATQIAGETLSPNTGNSTCAVLSTGQVGCWGTMLGYSLGDGHTYSANSPITVQGITGAIQVAVGAMDVCVVSQGGELQCWGANYHGELGNGTTTEASVPVSAALSNVAAVSVGDLFTCALTTNGGVECVGDNNWGELGSGSDNARAYLRNASA